MQLLTNVHLNIYVVLWNFNISDVRTSQCLHLGVPSNMLFTTLVFVNPHELKFPEIFEACMAIVWFRLR